MARCLGKCGKGAHQDYKYCPDCWKRRKRAALAGMRDAGRKFPVENPRRDRKEEKYSY